MIKVKICGITNPTDALAAIESGADALGFVFYPPSPRYIHPQILQDWIQELPPFVSKVGVFVDEDANLIEAICDSCQLDLIQLQGKESPLFCQHLKRPVIKAFSLKREEDLVSLKAYRNPQIKALLLDSFGKERPGGTGITCDWSLARKAKEYGRIILAGGLNPNNVQAAIAEARPYAVDVSSGVELSPGKKDRVKMRDFIQAAKGCRGHD